MLDAIHQYRQAGETEKAQVLAKNWKRNFGFSAFGNECASGFHGDGIAGSPGGHKSSLAQEDNGKPLTPRQIGKTLFPKGSARSLGFHIDRLLCDAGLQIRNKNKRGYVPTSKGKDFIFGRRPYGVTMLWKTSITDFLKKYLDEIGAL